MPYATGRNSQYSVNYGLVEYGILPPELIADLRRDFTWFDRLPYELRDALRDYNTVFNSADTYQAHQRFGITTTMTMLRTSEHNDIVRFASKFRAKYKLPYPHLEAKVSILRYGPLTRNKPKETPNERRRRRKLRHQGFSSELVDY